MRPDWRSAFLTAAAVSVLLGAVAVVAFVDSPAPDPASVAASTRTGEGVRGPLDAGVEQALLRRLEDQEGFRDTVYVDTRGFRTIGYGTLMPISRAEGELLLRHRLEAAAKELIRRWPSVTEMPLGVQVGLIDAAYQLGVSGLLGFHDMLAALERRDWIAAAAAAEDSRWNRETPARVLAFVAALRAHSDSLPQ